MIIPLNEFNLTVLTRKGRSNNLVWLAIFSLYNHLCCKLVYLSCSLSLATIRWSKERLKGNHPNSFFASSTDLIFSLGPVHPHHIVASSHRLQSICFQIFDFPRHVMSTCRRLFTWGCVLLGPQFHIKQCTSSSKHTVSLTTSKTFT